MACRLLNAAAMQTKDSRCSTRRSRLQILIALSLLGFGLRGYADAAPPGGALDRHLRKLVRERSAAQVDVIVTLQPDQRLGPPFTRFVCSPYLSVVNGYALCKLPVKLLDGLSATYGVHRVSHNRPARGSDFLTTSAVQAEILARESRYTGAGVTVALIDSGITYEPHPDLQDGRVLGTLDFVEPRSRQRQDGHGHGTHIAGIIGGTGALDTRYAGLAPGTNLVSLRVLDESGKGSIANIITALEWVANNHRQYNIRIVNLSVGAGVTESYWTDPLTLAAKALVDRGITVVAAAGNFGKNAEGELQWGGITAPGVAPWVLTVCAFSTMGSSDPSDDEVAGFSSSGPTAIDFTAKPDVCAPGVGVVSLAAPESALYRKGAAASPSWLLGSSPSYAHAPYISLTGSSQAAPVVSATVALMLEANPSLTPNLIKAIVQYTARSKAGVSALRQGAGFVNTGAAVSLAEFYANPAPGAKLPVDPSWSQHIIWGNHRLGGGVLDPGANAWMPGVEWGWAYTQGRQGEHVVWGHACDDACENIVWGISDEDENIVWGTADEDENIVWGTADDDENIVWGTAAEENLVWPINRSGFQAHQ